ncbi:MAG TPA: YciI family protein [Azospirillaceae bacterium]|nr:YciI family protein [Azospirillaceae bacterium]
MPTFVLLLHEDPATFADVSPAEMQRIIEAYGAWAGRMAGQGRLAGGHKLTDDGGKRVRKEGGRVVVTDGPYLEAKDVIGGFFLIKAADYEEVARLLEDCPAAQYGTVEVRQVDPLGQEG